MNSPCHRRRAGWFILAGLLLLNTAQSSAQPMRAGSPTPSSPSASGSGDASRKIVARLRALIAEVRTLAPGGEPRALTEAAARFSSETVRMDNAGRVQVYVTVADTSERTLETLRRHGLVIEVVNVELGIVQGLLPVAQLEALAAEPVVLKIRPPSYATPNVGPVTTQGDSILRCDQARALGFTGAGVKIGAISTGVSGLAQSQASGELGDVEVLSSGGDDEGTAILEIIHDCAPDATLIFTTGNTSLEFIQSVNALRSVGAQIIIDDLAFLADPYFEDGPTAGNHRLAAAGALMVTSAGNRALAHYQDMFVPGSFDPQVPGTRHDFGGGDTLLRFQLPAGTSASIFLQWGNPWGGAMDDYDLCVRQTTGAFVGCSALPQDGTDDPIELLSLECPAAATPLCLGDIQVTLFSGSARPIEIYCTNPCQFQQFNVRGDSVFGHKAVPEVLAVAAAPASDPTSIEPYSSAGPATVLFPKPEVRFKPDLTAPDGVMTSRPTFNPFFGTSAAAPHVAAIAALVMQANPTYALVAPQALSDALKASAIDLGAAGPDSDFGFGRADALNAVQAELAKARCQVESNKSSVRVGEEFTVTLRTVPGAGDPWAVFAFAVIFGNPLTFFAVDLATGAFGPPNVIQPSAPPGSIASSSQSFTFQVPFVGQVGAFCVLATPDLTRVSPFSLAPIAFTP